MRLTDLHPRWVAPLGTTGLRTGLRFDCPCCQVQRVVIAFDQPIFYRAAAIKGATRVNGEVFIWQRTGDTFETISLSPSLNASQWQPPHWHGVITNGEVT